MATSPWLTPCCARSHVALPPAASLLGEVRAGGAKRMEFKPPSGGSGNGDNGADVATNLEAEGRLMALLQSKYTQLQAAQVRGVSGMVGEGCR